MIVVCNGALEATNSGIDVRMARPRGECRKRVEPLLRGRPCPVGSTEATWARWLKGTPPHKAGASSSPFMFGGLSVIKAGHSGKLIFKKAEKRREVPVGRGLLHSSALEEGVGGGSLSDVFQGGRAEGQTRREAPGSFKTPDHHGPRGRPQEHADGAMWTESPVNHRVDGVNRRTETGRYHEEVVPFVAAGDVCRSVDDTADEVDKAGVDELIWFAVEITADDPGSRQGTKSTGCQVEQVDVRVM